MVKYNTLKRLAVSVSVLALAVAPALSAGALVVRDDGGVGGSLAGAGSDMQAGRDTLKNAIERSAFMALSLIPARYVRQVARV